MIYRQNWPAAPLVAAVGACALLASSCGNDSSPVTTPPIAAVPPPATSPPPSTGGPGASSCPLGEGTETGECARTSTSMIHYIEAAIDAVVAEHPEFFDLAVEAGNWTRQYRVLDKEGYIDGVVDKLREMSLCAQRTDYDYELVQIKEDIDRRSKPKRRCKRDLLIEVCIRSVGHVFVEPVATVCNDANTADNLAAFVQRKTTRVSSQTKWRAFGANRTGARELLAEIRARQLAELHTKKGTAGLHELQRIEVILHNLASGARSESVAFA